MYVNQMYTHCNNTHTLFMHDHLQYMNHMHMHKNA